jgi:hypothetical protein
MKCLTELPTLSADQSARCLRIFLAGRQSFFFARLGDGAIECIGKHRRAGHTCDGEPYTSTLAGDLKNAVTMLIQGNDQVIWGDWRTAVAGSPPTYTGEWEALVDAGRRRLLHYEALYLRPSIDCVDFYTALRADRRKKLYLGPCGAAMAAQMVGACHLALPVGGLEKHAAWLREAIEAAHPEIILFGAGMAGLAVVARYWFTWRETTCIHIGSALDPLWSLRPTRGGQMRREEVHAYFGGMLS